MSKMPELPEAGFTLSDLTMGKFSDYVTKTNYYTAQQMHDYARAYAESEAGRLREAVDGLVEKWHGEEMRLSGSNPFNGEENSIRALVYGLCAAELAALAPKEK